MDAMRTLLIGLVAVLLALPGAQAASKKPRPGSEQRPSQAQKKPRLRPAARPVVPAPRVAPEPLYDTEKAMR
jgi:hypothetical protein